MSETTKVLIAATEAEHAVARDNPTKIEDRLIACFKQTRHHWMAPSDDDAFKAGIVAALKLTTDEADKDRLTRSTKALSRLSAIMAALQAGVRVDLEEEAAKPKEDDLLPLNALWQQSAP